VKWRSFITDSSPIAVIGTNDSVLSWGKAEGFLYVPSLNIHHATVSMLVVSVHSVEVVGMWVLPSECNLIGAHAKRVLCRSPGRFNLYILDLAFRREGFYIVSGSITLY
jgi:hypothetical protein